MLFSFQRKTFLNFFFPNPPPGEKILLTSSSSTFDDPVFEDASEFAQKLESSTEQLVDELIDEASGTLLQVPAPAAGSDLLDDQDLEHFDLDPLDFDSLLLEDAAPSTSSSSSNTSSSDNNNATAVLDFDDTELDMYIQSSSYANAHHSRQPIQQYGHSQLRQSGYLPHHPQVFDGFLLLRIENCSSKKVISPNGRI